MTAIESITMQTPNQAPFCGRALGCRSSVVAIRSVNLLPTKFDIPNGPLLMRVTLAEPVTVDVRPQFLQLPLPQDLPFTFSANGLAEVQNMQVPSV
jgi:hypothetical protein